MSKFILIYEEVLNKTLEQNNFKYKFELDTVSNDLICKFESIDKNSNKLIFITAKIFGSSNQLEFNVTNDEQKTKKYTDKEFLMSYYKEYKNFKNAYKVYKQDPNFFNPSANKQEQNDIPQIEFLDDILMQDSNQNQGTTIKEDGILFTFKSLNSDTIANLTACSFILNNTSYVKSSDDLPEYFTIATIKMEDINSKIVKFELYKDESSTDTTPLKELTEVDFKDKFKSIYFALEKALKKYEQYYQKSEIKNI